MSNKMLIERLRTMCADIRRKPIALEHLIPLMQEAATEMERLRAVVEALRADAEKKDALLVRAHDLLGCVGGSPEGASKDIWMAEELQRDIDAARSV